MVASYSYYNRPYIYGGSLRHYGILGMHWGIRRYQPYTYNPRKGGVTGRLIGEAARAMTRGLLNNYGNTSIKSFNRDRAIYNKVPMNKNTRINLMSDYGDVYTEWLTNREKPWHER